MTNQYPSYPPPGEPNQNLVVGERKSMILVVILAVFVGSLGIHNFYLGYIARGLTQLILSVVGWMTTFLLIGYVPLAIVFIWVLIEIILVLSNKDYRDANGVPLHR